MVSNVSPSKRDLRQVCRGAPSSPNVMHSDAGLDLTPQAFSLMRTPHLVSNPAIIRNRRKIEAITNALCVTWTRLTRRCPIGALAWSYRPDADPHPTCAVEFCQLCLNRAPRLPT